jgi:hypothetical protein
VGINLLVESGIMDPTGAIVGALLGALGALACVYAAHRLTSRTTRQENRQKAYARLRALSYALAEANWTHCEIQVYGLRHNALSRLPECHEEASLHRNRADQLMADDLLAMRELGGRHAELLDTVGTIALLFPCDADIRQKAGELLRKGPVQAGGLPDDANTSKAVDEWLDAERPRLKNQVDSDLKAPLTAFADLVEKAMSRPRVSEWLRLVPALAAAVMLVLAMGRPGSDYYFLLSWIVTASAAYVAIQAATSRWPLVPLVFILIGVLFNPVVEPGLSSDTWDTLAILSIIAFAAVALFDGVKLALAWRRYRRAKAPAPKKKAEPQPKKAD